MSEEKIYKVSVEGQEITLPAEIAVDDNKVKQALAPYYPGASTAKIERTEKDGVITVKVIKQAGPKGNGILDALDACEEKVNPVEVLYRELYGQDPRAFSLPQILRMRARIDEALTEGYRQRKMMNTALEKLTNCTPRPADFIPVGF